MSIVNVKDFTFTYPGAEESTLNQVSFDIRRGEVLGIIGPVGAGKTTLCMAVAGFAPRITGGETSGELELNAEDLQSPPHRTPDTSDRENHQDEERNHPVGMIFEDYVGQLTQLKVLDEAITPLLNQGLSEQDAKNRACELLNTVGLDDNALHNKYVWELSAGQQQRLAIAATLALDPQILIFDKAIDRLDPRGQEKVRQVIENLAGDRTLVVVEQDTHLLMQIADRLLVIANGQVLAEGSPEEILRNDDLLSRADVKPPVSLQVARALGLSDAPLTPEEFEQSLHQSHQPQAGSPELREVMPSDHHQSANNQSKQPIVQLEHVSFRYPDNTQALDEVNINIHAGKVHAVVGNSNAGKTTLVLHLAGLLKPTKGKVSICGIDTRERSATELAAMVGTVFQNPDDQISERTVRAEIGFPLKQRQYERTGLFQKSKRYNDQHIEQQVSQVCELVGLDEKLLDRDPVLLPAGLRRLVTIAEALVMNPQAMSLDEPSVGLSATSRHQLQQTIRHLRKMGRAVLLAENDIDFVVEVADTVTVLDQGRIVLHGSVQDVFAEKNWEMLSHLYIRTPHVAQLAYHIGVNALTLDELVSKLALQPKEA